MLKKIIYSIVVALIISCVSPNLLLVQANGNENLTSYETDEQSIKITETVEENVTIITTTLNTEDVYVQSDLSIDFETNEISLDNLYDDNSGEVIQNKYEVNLLTIDGEDFRAIFIDKETGEETYINTAEVQASVAPLVVVLATVARYGFTRAVSKHGLARVTQAQVSNASKTKLATDAAAKELATELGYAKTAYRTKAGAAVFKRSAKDAVDGPDFISRDRTSHIGGVWKGANKKWENLNSDKSRSGTYDAVLKRIGD
ncbi:SAR2788 family putative toxin [Lysinibacillus sp. NPDC095746]|uniref:SAR2788 family putative toxin n=1 Tax=Lysinibacillus sp. NPDC095746 TaxID=3364134 RepID=UPI003812BA9E